MIDFRRVATDRQTCSSRLKQNDYTGPTIRRRPLHRSIEEPFHRDSKSLLDCHDCLYPGASLDDTQACHSESHVGLQVHHTTKSTLRLLFTPIGQTKMLIATNASLLQAPALSTTFLVLTPSIQRNRSSGNTSLNRSLRVGRPTSI
jgi:hypothetical protein